MALWKSITSKTADKELEALEAGVVYDVGEDIPVESYERVEEGYKRKKLTLEEDGGERVMVSREAMWKANYKHLERYGLPGRGYNNRFELVRGAPPMPYPDAGTCSADDYLFLKDAHRPVGGKSESECMLPSMTRKIDNASCRRSFGHSLVELKNKWFGGK